MNMEESIEMRSKGLFRRHPKISKKSKNTTLGLKLEEICFVKVYLFFKIAKSQMFSKMHFFAKWAYLFMFGVCLRFRSWQKRNCTRFGRKLKIKRGLVKTIQNFMDLLTVLYGMSMQKISLKLFS